KSNAPHCFPAGVEVPDIARHEFDRIIDPLEILQSPGRQIVQHPDLLSTNHEGMDEVRADKTRPSRHKEHRHLLSVLVVVRLSTTPIKASTLFERLTHVHPKRRTRLVFGERSARNERDRSEGS